MAFVESELPGTQDTEILEDEETLLLIDARERGDFALLFPDSHQAKRAFSEVADEAQISNEAWKKYMSISSEKISLETPTSNSDSDNVLLKESRFWKGHYRINLGEEMLPPTFSQFGWLLGSGRKDLKDGGVDLRLTLDQKRDRVRGRHAALAFDPLISRLCLVVGRRKYVRLSGELLENNERLCTEHQTSIQVGLLHYTLRYTGLGHKRLMNQLQGLHSRGRIQAISHKGIDLTPTPNQMQYRDYIIHPPFAKGTFGMISACVNRNGGLPLVVKRIERNKRTRAEIINEVNILERVGGHQNTCELVEVFYSGSSVFQSPADDAYIFFRPLAEMNFDEYRKTGPDDDSMLAAFYQAIRGLEWIHSKGIMHRDIKPNNLLISANPAVLVTVADYGHAIKATESKDHGKGTLNYLAPEVWALKLGESDLPYGLEADIWSLACCFVEFRILGTDRWQPLDFRDRSFYSSTVELLQGRVSAIDEAIHMLWKFEDAHRPKLSEVVNWPMWSRFAQPPGNKRKSSASDGDERVSFHQDDAYPRP